MFVLFQAVNNMAVCALYRGQLKNAISILEDLINTDPSKYLQEGILFNLCTLYELESSHAMKKKKRLLLLVNKHRGNGFNSSCLKLNYMPFRCSVIQSAIVHFKASLICYTERFVSTV